MPIKKENRAAFEILRKQYHIEFNDEIAANEWPANHRRVFESIQKVKQYRYSTYAVAQKNEDDLDAAPWKAEAKTQARKLTKAAKDCISRNEATWRFACEPIVFSRLAAEVACKNCRKRVWRSEIEAALVDENSRAAASLRQRQQNRERCRCARETRPGDEDERVGLNKLFIYRTDDTVIHPEELRVELPQTQKPDRTYGLRQTRNFENLLFKPMGADCFIKDHLENGCSIVDHLQEQPHDNGDGEPLLFPFLVVEAKAGNASDDWSSIRLQTAFPIYTYLNTQQSLRSATMQRSKWTSGPLVWFFMSKGEDWRLCLAFQTPAVGDRQSSDNTHQITNIVQVWAGVVTTLDDALQLFLIVDFMSDWARDTYRPALLTELRTLHSVDAGDRATVFTDTDIFSSKGILPSHAFGDIKTEPQPDAQEIQEAFRSLDSSHGIVRHISPIKSRFASLLITAENFKAFSSAIPQIKRLQFIRRILNQFHSAGQTPSFLRFDQLSCMEELWTGHLRPSHSFRLKDTKFFTIHIITYSFSASWEQVRELCVIAIAEDAFEAVIAESQLKVGKGKAKVPKITTMAQDYINFVNIKLFECLNTINNTAAQQNLLASICRASHYIDSMVDQSLSTQWFKSSPPDILELVNSLRKYHKKGDIEPDLSFLYTSESYKTQMVEQDDADGANSDDLSSIASSDENDGACFNHHRACPLLMGNLRVSREGAVLIYGSGGSYQPVEERSPSALCVYIIHGPTEPPDNATLARIIKNNFEEHDVYHTTRKHRKIWNLRKPYGVFFPYGGPCFTEWLTAMNKPLPTRQGSPRSTLDSGRMIFSRNYFRGQDPRLLLLNYGQSSYATIKKQFALFLLLQDVVAWAAIAYKKKCRGTPCCKLCAEKFDATHYEDLERDGYIPGLCDDCYIELDVHSGCGLPPSVKIILRKFLEGISEDISAIDAGVNSRNSVVRDFWEQVRSSI